MNDLTEWSWSSRVQTLIRYLQTNIFYTIDKEMRPLKNDLKIINVNILDVSSFDC